MTNKWIMALILGLATVACAPKETEATTEDGAAPEQVAPKELTAKDYQASKSQIDSVSYLIGINFGSFIKGYNFGDNLNYSQIVKGIKDFVAAKGSFRDPEFNEQFKINPELMNDMFNEYLENRHNYTLCVNKEAEAKFLAANAKKEGVQVTESGLQYKIINEGNENKPADVDTVWVNYKGSLINGDVFDETPADSEPIRMVLNRVVRGWQEGLQLIGEGGEIELYVPAELGYGENGTQGIEPNSTLIFNVKLDKVGKFVPAAEEE